MSRHIRTPRLNSGILFSPPAAVDAKVDVWSPKGRNRIAHCKMNLPAGSNVPWPEVPDDFQDSSQVLSAFPRFWEASTSRSSTKRSSGSNESELLLPVTLCLPSLSVSADVLIDGSISSTTLTQSFYNSSELVIPQARHTFPLYDGAVVTTFECRIGDARRLQGVVKPTAQARREFEESKAKREAAALLEELAPEVFETSLGNIPPKTKVDVTLTYVHQLKVVTSREEKAEGLALTIPTSITPRYAEPLPELPRDKMEITIRVLDDGTIDAAACHVESNHAATYQGSQPLITNISELGSLDLPAGGAQKMQHVWQYSSNSHIVLGSDFVLVIQMRQETRLRSRAVIAPANEFGHAALMVSLRPNDIFGSAVNPQMFKGEILFVLDQSGSMGWTRLGSMRLKIDTMRDAMSLALSGLPSTCRFNIISFGSEVRGMWLRSRGADEAGNLSDARRYLTSVEANMGGTEILLALKGAVNNCEPSLPSTQIILITDGEVYDEPQDAILEFVWKTRQRFGEKIRFFTLGIGDAVSHRVVEGIAELGGGYCDVVDVVKKPRWEDRVNRMLRSAMEPDSWTCDIDLGSGFERRSLATCQFGDDDRSDAHSTLYVQGPHPMLSLSPYKYKSFFFLLDIGSAELPKTVTIKTTTDSAREKIYNMNVEPTQLRSGTIHPLAVKMALQSLVNEVDGVDVSKEQQARINAEMLGTRYSVSSKWTSFVAVPDESREQSYSIDVYKSVFKEANMQALLGSESEESTEDEGLDSTCNGQRRSGWSNVSNRYTPTQSPGIRFRRSTRPNIIDASLPSYSLPGPPLPPPRRRILISGEEERAEEDEIPNVGTSIDSKSQVDQTQQTCDPASGSFRSRTSYRRSTNPAWFETYGDDGMTPKSCKTRHHSPDSEGGGNTDGGEDSRATADAGEEGQGPPSKRIKTRIDPRPAPEPMSSRSFDSKPSYIMDSLLIKNLEGEEGVGDSKSRPKTKDKRRGRPSKAQIHADKIHASPRPILSYNGKSTEVDGDTSAAAPPLGHSLDRYTGSASNTASWDFSESKGLAACRLDHASEGEESTECGEELAAAEKPVGRPSHMYHLEFPGLIAEQLLSQPSLPRPSSQSPLTAGGDEFGTWTGVALDDKDVTAYKPSGDGPLTWEDVVGCENSGMFVLTTAVRERLSQHFCGKTVERLQETLRDPSSAAQIPEHEVAVLTDTLMMIQYCKTHLATQEDYWHLLVDKVERAVLLALGYEQDKEEALEPFYEKLLSAILHVHFLESLGHASIYQGEGDGGESLDSLGPEMCLVCDSLIEKGAKGQLVTNKGFMCLADECYNGETQTRRQYSSWSMFWEHQVESGHVLCPRTDGRPSCLL